MSTGEIMQEPNWEVQQYEVCVCGHTRFWHSLESGLWVPAWSGCLAGCGCENYQRDHSKAGEQPEGGN